MNTQNPHDSQDQSPYSSYQPDAADATADGAADGFDTRQLREEAEQRLNDAAEQAREKLGELQGTIEGYIREKPVQTLLVAAGVGLLVGTLLKR